MKTKIYTSKGFIEEDGWAVCVLTEYGDLIRCPLFETEEEADYFQNQEIKVLLNISGIDYEIVVMNCSDPEFRRAHKLSLYSKYHYTKIYRRIKCYFWQIVLVAILLPLKRYETWREKFERED